MSSTITERVGGAVDGIPVQRMGYGIVRLTQTAGINDITVTASPDITDWIDGQHYSYKPTAANTGAMTVTHAAAGATNLRKPNGSTLSADDIQTGLEVLMVYDSANTQLRIIGSGF